MRSEYEIKGIPNINVNNITGWDISWVTAPENLDLVLAGIYIKKITYLKYQKVFHKNVIIK